jgi:hypothetical protein
MQNMKIFMIIFILIFVLLITDNIEFFKDLNKIRVAILIITLRGQERHENERKQWEKYMKKYSNVDCFFIECDNKENFETIYSKCGESYIPGIFQKSILSLDKVGNKYDFYIRTNLSSFFIIQNLLDKLETLPQLRPYYSGVYCAAKSWVGGFGILLNKKSREILLTNAFKKKYFEDSKTPDDVMIGRVLLDNNIRCEHLDDLWYGWDYNKEYNENLKEVNKRNTPIIRIKNDNIKVYNKVCDRLFQQFY